MSRKRSALPDGPFHVICNAVEGGVLFHDDLDRRRYIGLLQQATERYGWGVLTFVLMDTHLHLLLWTPTALLSEGMWWLNLKYARWYKRRRHPHKGHVFGGEFRSLPITDDVYLAAVLRYIPHNPVRAKMVRSPDAYAWSADRLLRTADDRLGFLAVSRALEMFDGDPARYAAFVDGREPACYGTVVRFAEGRPAERPPLADLLRDPTDEALAVAHLRWAYTLAEIGQHIGRHHSTVQRRIART